MHVQGFKGEGWRGSELERTGRGEAGQYAQKMSHAVHLPTPGDDLRS